MSRRFNRRGAVKKEVMESEPYLTVTLVESTSPDHYICLIKYAEPASKRIKDLLRPKLQDENGSFDLALAVRHTAVCRIAHKMHRGTIGNLEESD